MPSAISIGALARLARVSVQTLRHYDAIGLLIPSERTKAGYRVYSDTDRGRLELIRALRELDFDLTSIRTLLQKAPDVRAMLELHVGALAIQAQAIERRRAVLSSLLQKPGPIHLHRLTEIQQLASIETHERAHFVQTALDERLRGAETPTLHDLIRRAADVEFPEAPTATQLTAWLELAELVSDPAFLARHRTQPAHARRPQIKPDELVRLYEPAAEAVRNSVDVASAQGRVIVTRWMDEMARLTAADVQGDVTDRARVVRQRITQEGDPRETRFWMLLGELNPAVRRSPVIIAWPWLLRGLDVLSQDVADLATPLYACANASLSESPNTNQH